MVSIPPVNDDCVRKGRLKLLFSGLVEGSEKHVLLLHSLVSLERSDISKFPAPNAVEQ